MNTKLRIGDKTISLTIENDETLMSAIQRCGAAFHAPCGGKGTCGKCRVKLLRNGNIPLREVLACQTTGAQLTQIWVRERFDTVEAAQAGEIQTQRKRDILLPADVIRDGDAPEEAHYGIAFDIGTTTVAAMLWDLAGEEQEDLTAQSGEQGSRAADGAVQDEKGIPESEKQSLTREGPVAQSGEHTPQTVGLTPIATASAANPQSAFGADVISRLEYAAGNGERLQQMQGLVVQCMNRLIETLTETAGISNSNIHRLSAVGNTTMMHFLFRRDPSGLTKAPFRGEELPMETAAAELGLAVEKGVQLRTLPVMGGHLGSDAAAVLLALRLPEKGEATLALDIGTNGELLLTDGCGGLWGCSTAAGPAFEGGNISCGMRGEPGAIETVRPTVDGSGLEIGVVGETEAKGLCGSGLIDAAAALLQTDRMDEEGRLAEGDSVSLAKGVELTQKDIRQLQMAKGAIAAGERILMKQTEKPLSAVYLAGAFGSYIRPESAKAIGLLPQKIPAVSCGNAAGAGASMILLSTEEWKQGCDWAGRLTHIELAQEPEFTETFLEAMYFPKY